MKSNQMLFVFTLCVLMSLFSSLSAEVVISDVYNVTTDMVINDDVLVTSTGVLTSYGGHHTLTINGNVTNNGTIRNHEYGYNLYLEISGDIINNGNWSCANTYLTGTSSQEISCGITNSFSGWNFYNDNVNNIIAQSNLIFLNSRVDFQNNGHLDLSGGSNLNINGGSIHGADIIGEPISGSGLNMTNYAYAVSCSLTDIISTGITLIADNGSSITGFFINNGTLKSTGGDYTLTVNGDITNNGTIRNHEYGYNLYLEISGDIINNGNWMNTDIELVGSDQHVSCTIDNTFAIDSFYGNSTSRGDIYFDSDIWFNDTAIDLNGDNVVLQSGVSLFMAGGHLYDGSLSGTDAEINMTGDNHLHSLTINIDDLVLSGVCLISNNDVVMTENVVNNGTLKTFTADQTLNISGNITNNGTITNGTYGHNFYLKVSGQVINNGNWINTTSYINGTTSQTITIMDSHEITGDVRFNSDIVIAPYQWKFNGTDLDDTDFAGETTSQLDWNVPVASGWFGTFNCFTDEGLSRNIIVTMPPPETPQNFTISIVGSNVQLDWDDVAGANSYTVFSDSDPNGSFETTEWTGVVSEWSEAIPGDKKFYRVTSSN